MNQQDAIQQAKELNERWPGIKWIVIKRGSEFKPKILGSSLNGHRLGIDFSESDIAWKPVIQPLTS